MNIRQLLHRWSSPHRRVRGVNGGISIIMQPEPSNRMGPRYRRRCQRRAVVNEANSLKLRTGSGYLPPASGLRRPEFCAPEVTA